MNEYQELIYCDQRDMLLNELESLDLSDGKFFRCNIPFINVNGERVWKEIKIYQKDKDWLFKKFKKIK